MKNLILNTMILAAILSFAGCKSSTDPSAWKDKQIDKWFEKGEWNNGWKVKPDASINRKEFAISYFRHKDRWDKAFKFLKENDLLNMEVKRYELEGDNLYAPISEYLSKNDEDARFEAHRKYIDIQFVISGKELMNIAPIASVKEILTPYDEVKDVEFVTVQNVVNYNATPENFFIFFPGDVHRPGLKDGENSKVRKVVVKVKVE